LKTGTPDFIQSVKKPYEFNEDGIPQTSVARQFLNPELLNLYQLQEEF
jgi:hypothetical protein